ncbi:hypothetical protein AKJ16_DCAP20924 [Drosera capensis]
MDHQAIVVSSSRALEGVHGVHVVPHSPFALEEIPKHGDHNQSTLQSSATVTGQQLMLQRLWQQKPACLTPIHCCLSSGDQSVLGTVANVITSLPFIALGINAPRQEKSELNENPKLLMAASAVCLPFQPLMVSAVHTGMMEVAFAKRALENPQLRTAHNVHKISSLLGGVFFVADDMFPTTPFLHAAWHLAAAVCVGTCNKLLE